METHHQPSDVDVASDIFIIPLLNIAGSAILLYGNTLRMTKNAVLLSRNIIRVIILLVAVMIALEIWGIPTNPIYIFLIVAVLVFVLAFRDAFPNFFAGIQIGANNQIKVGDYIKLETGEEGYITRIGWSDTPMQTPDENTVIVPNARLLQRTVINCGQPLKKVYQAFPIQYTENS